MQPILMYLSAEYFDKLPRVSIVNSRYLDQCKRNEFFRKLPIKLDWLKIRNRNESCDKLYDNERSKYVIFQLFFRLFSGRKSQSWFLLRVRFIPVMAIPANRLGERKNFTWKNSRELRDDCINIGIFVVSLGDLSS